MENRESPRLPKITQEESTTKKEGPENTNDGDKGKEQGSEVRKDEAQAPSLRSLQGPLKSGYCLTQHLVFCQTPSDNPVYWPFSTGQVFENTKSIASARRTLF